MRENAHDWQWNESCTLDMTGVEDISAWRKALARNVKLRFPFITAVQQPLCISICISTLPTQHIMFIKLL